jgi:hypothetical protein
MRAAPVASAAFERSVAFSGRCKCGGTIGADGLCDRCRARADRQPTAERSARLLQAPVARRVSGDAAGAPPLAVPASRSVTTASGRCECGGTIGQDGLCDRCRTQDQPRASDRAASRDAAGRPARSGSLHQVARAKDLSRAPAANPGTVALRDGPVLQRVPTSYDPVEQKKLIEEGIRDKDIGKIKDVEENAYSLASDDQAIDMVMIILDQGWVGPRDENAIYHIWNSRGKGVIDLASKFTYVWNMCLQRGVDTLWDIPDLAPIKDDFTSQVATRARNYLDDNKKVVNGELNRYGLDDMSASPSATQAQEREALMQAGVAVNKARNAIKTMDSMLIGYQHTTGTPADNKTELCTAMFNPEMPPPLPGHLPVPAEPGAVLPTWDDTHKNYERAHAVIDHYTGIYPALVALREDTDLQAFAAGAMSSEAPNEQLEAMKVMGKALHDTSANIDKTYPLLTGKAEFALELQPIHEQIFLSEADWKDPFKQLVARRAIEEHGNVEFWNTMGLAAVGLALFVVAELSTGGLATFFFAAAAGTSIAQAASSWDKYFTEKAASETHMSKETALISSDQASAQFVTAALDTVMAFMDAYGAGKGAADALEAAAKAEARLAEAAGKEAQAVAERTVEVAPGHDVVAGERGFTRCSPSCPLFEDFWGYELADRSGIKVRVQGLSSDKAKAMEQLAEIDHELQSITANEIDDFLDGLEDTALHGKPRLSKLKLDPKYRLDIANTPLTDAQRAQIDQTIAEMKADGRLPADYVHRPPDIPGALIDRDTARLAASVSGVKISDVAPVEECWKESVEVVLRNEELTADNYDRLYNNARSNFWRRVGTDGSAAEWFKDKGFVLDGSSAPTLRIDAPDGVNLTAWKQQMSLALDHMMPKASGDNWAHALDGDQIQFLFSADNTKLAALEKAFSDLRR